MPGPPPPIIGTVFRILGKVVSVRPDDPQYGLHQAASFDCYLRGRLFEAPPSASEVHHLRNQVVVGDRVELTPLEEAPPGREGAKAIIHRVLERRNALLRRAGRRKPVLQCLAANLDLLVIVSALDRPRYKTGLIDRYFVIARDAGIDAALCLNKLDLGEAETIDKARLELSPYQRLGCALVLTSAKTGQGLDELAALLRDKRSVLVGHSGVGKSKLAGRLIPEVELQSSTVDRRGRGRHTTSVATLFSLPSGGELVDTPGVRELGIGHLQRGRLALCFPEMEPLLGDCRFPSCSHIPEPDCAVKRAVKEGRISLARYQSYVGFYEELGERG